LFLLTGEPGIGKTRAAAEFAAVARDRGARVLWGRCWEGTGAPAYWPWVQAIRSLLREENGGTLAELMGHGASDLAQMFPELHDLFPELPPLPSRDAESARFQLFDSATTFLGRAADSQPIVLVLDDIHSADTPSLLFLRFVAAQLAVARIVLVATYRHAELTPEHPLTEVALEIAREPTTQEIRLLGLGEPEIAAFVEESTHVRPEPGLVARLHRDTTGNPLYLEQAVRLNATEGRLDTLSEVDLLHLSVPARISDLIVRRVDHVSERCADALRLASVLGAEFGFEVLRRLGDSNPGELFDVLDEAVDAGLILRMTDPSQTFTFSHDLVRETLYEGITHSERVSLHAKTATVLENTYGEDVDPHLAALAFHFFEAAPGGHADRAVEYARLAGARATESLAYEEAARLQAMALSALEMLPAFEESVRVEILLDLGDALTRAAEDARAKDTFLRAAGIARRIGQPTQLARAALGYGGIFVWQRAGADREMVPLLQDALMMLGGGDDQLRVRLLSRLACAIRDTPDREKSDALSAEAVRTARALNDPGTLCYALEGRIAAIMWPENPEERLDLTRELINIAERHQQQERVISGRLFEVVCLCDLGLIPEARHAVESLTREAEHLRQPNQLFVAQIMGTFMDLIEGHFEMAETEILSAIDKGFWARDEYSTTRCHLFLLRREQGRLAEIEEFVRTSVHDYPWYPLHRSALVCLLAELGRHHEAQQVFDELSHDEFALLNRDNEWLLGMSLASEACFLLGDAQAAVSLYDQLLPFAGRHAVGWAEGSVGVVDRYLGLLASMLDRPDDAVEHFEDAIAINHAMGARPWTAHCQHDYGRVLLARDAVGDLERAAELFAASDATAEELGMTALSTKLSDVQGRARAAPGEPSAVVQQGIFRREGEYWTVSLGEEPVRLHDMKGLGYLARLLAAPGKEIHVLDLAQTGEVRLSEPGEDLKSSGLDDAGEVLDAKARAAYRRRIEELAEDLEQAEGWYDTERAAQVREEMDFLTKELSGAEGLGGRARKVGSAAERARVNVTRAIRTAINRVDNVDAELGRHLDATVRTGTFCSYMPDPRTPINWQL
jgi:tetratricopeptide (TPR) repeat protein